MNAIQPSIPPNQPKKPRKVTTQKNREMRQRRFKGQLYRSMALENTAKVAVNLVISAAALSSLVHLLPYLWSQQQKWQEVYTQVQQTQTRVDSLRTDFSRYFDPQQAKTVMKEQSNRLEPGQRPVILFNQPAKKQ